MNGGYLEGVAVLLVARRTKVRVMLLVVMMLLLLMLQVQLLLLLPLGVTQKMRRTTLLTERVLAQFRVLVEIGRTVHLAYALQTISLPQILRRSAQQGQLSGGVVPLYFTTGCLQSKHNVLISI